MNERSPTVFVIDDDAAVRKAVARLPHSVRIEAAVFASPVEFLAAYDPDIPGCLLLDLEMPDLNGLELQQALTERGGALPIIFLSAHGDVPLSVQAMKAGASDFLTKPVRDQVLRAAVRAAFEKDRVARLVRAELTGIEARLATLTPREHEVLERVIAGQLNKQIAGDLCRGEHTIKVHRARVMEKMKVESLAELVRLVERARAPGADGVCN
jgi:FixJ family two-component response regulator